MKAQIFQKVILGLILAVILAKFIHIEADPWPIKSTADIHDEAWWAENAKLKCLENKWVKDDIAGGLAVSPIINIIYYGSFKLFGISFFSLRIFSVLASIFNIILYYFLSKRYLLTQKEALISTLLFASLPSYFILGRLGTLETGLISFLLLSIILVLQNKTWSIILAGITLALGLQLKGSFALLVPIVVALIFTQNKTSNKKEILILSISAALVSVLFYFFYYSPNIFLFQPYYTAFSNEFYSIRELFHPAGIVIRLGYLFSKETITDPFIFILIVLFIYRIVFYKFNKELNKLLLALFIGFVFTLFSDFNDKRLILLCIGFPIFITGNLNAEGKFSIAKLRYVAIFCSFSLFNLLPEIRLLNWQEPYLVGISIDSVIVLILLQVLVFTLLIQLEKQIRLNRIASFSYAFLITYFLSKVFSIILINQFNLKAESFFLFTVAFLCVTLIYYLIFKIRLNNNYLVSIIISFQLIYLSIQLSADTFEIRNLNLFFAQVGKDKERIIGPNSIFEIAFLGKKHPVYFSKEGKLSSGVSKADIIWFGAITNSEYSEHDLEKDLREAEKNLKMHFEPYYTVKIYKNQYKAFLFKRLVK